MSQPEGHETGNDTFTPLPNANAITPPLAQ